MNRIDRVSRVGRVRLGGYAAPTVTAAVVPASAAGTVEITLSSPVEVNDGAGFAVTASGGAVTVVAVDGSVTDARGLVLTLSRSIAAGETVSLAYTSGGGIVHGSLLIPLASFSGLAVRNLVA